VSEPRDPHDNPPGWTDPYSDLSNLSGREAVPPLEDPETPPATPPRSPLLTGLIVGLLLVAVSVAVFQLLRSDDEGDSSANATTTVAAGEEGTATTVAPGEATTTTVAGTPSVSLPPSDPYPPVGEPIPVSQLNLAADALRSADDAVADLEFGDPAETVIGALTSSFGDPNEDTEWQVSTGQWGVCTGDLERVIRFGPLAAILTLSDDTEIFNGYRQDLSYGDLESETVDLATLSGLKAGDTVEQLQTVYANQKVTFDSHPLLDEIFELRSASTDELLLWGPVRGQEPADLVIGIYAPDVCQR
jgi:hypothetical protein